MRRYLSVESDPLRSYAIFQFDENNISESQLEHTGVFRLCMLKGDYDFLNIDVKYIKHTNRQDVQSDVFVFKELDDLRYFLVNAENSGFGKPVSIRYEQLEMGEHYPEGGSRAFIKRFSKLPHTKGGDEKVGWKPGDVYKPPPEQDMSFADDW